ncbi:MAG TPA: hypothetical protein VGG97_21750 [Bryobacteraceae bacterium]
MTAAGGPALQAEALGGGKADSLEEERALGSDVTLGQIANLWPFTRAITLQQIAGSEQPLGTSRNCTHVSKRSGF